MNGTFKKSLIAVAITAVFSTVTVAVAQGQDGASSTSVQFNKKLKLKTDIKVSGDPTISGNIAIDSAAIAIVKNAQDNSGNSATNLQLSNKASAADTALGGSKGNIGVNIGSGDNNQQDNAAALSAADASFAFGMADAEVFVDQAGTGNSTTNVGVTNDASIGGDAFNAASGNIGVNITSGNNNQQKNAMAASVATSRYAQSSVSSNQASSGNTTSNVPLIDTQYTSVNVSLTGSASGTYNNANGVGTYSGGSTGTFDGTTASNSTGNAYQQSNLYPDSWTGATHPNGSSTGHIDIDNQTQGAVANPNRPGVGGFAFDTSSSGTGTASGTTGSTDSGTFQEQGDLALNNITLSGTVQYAQNLYTPTTNSATLSGTAFNGASGNIGINVSAGTGNQQANSLSLAVAQPSTATGGGSGGPPTE